MRFVLKKKLQEADINPLDVNSVDLTYDEQYVQAITKAVASESGAIVEYEQIMAIEQHVTSKSLVNLFHDTLEDIKDEEVKHLAQLNEKLSQAPSLKDAYKDGEEEAESGIDKEKSENDDVEKQEESMNESVPVERMYDAETITKIILSEFERDYTDPEFDNINQMLDPTNKNILTADEVDEGMLKLAQAYEFTDDEILSLEQKIAYSKDPNKVKAEDNVNDMKSDLEKLEDVFTTLYSQEAKDKLQKIIDELKMPKEEVL